MKIVLWALAVVGVYFIYQFSIGSVLKKYATCYDTATLALSDPLIAESDTCVIEKLQYDQMNMCISEIQQNNFSGFLYQASKTKKNIEADFEAHNKACPSNVVKAPKDAFYMSAGTKR